MSAVRDELDGGVLTLTIDRPEQRNALNGEVISGLLEGLRRAEAPDVRVVVITGEGDRAFCAGADLATTAVADGGIVAQHRAREPFVELLRRLRSVPRPVVARINGHALAGGFGL